MNRKFTLIDPVAWEDRNDSYFMEKYREVKNLQKVIALCLTAKAETFHQWKVFAGNASGLCMMFSADKLLVSFTKTQAIRTGRVEYKLVYELKKHLPCNADRPFPKRMNYEDEGEFRVQNESRSKRYQAKAARLLKLAELKIGNKISKHKIQAPKIHI